MKLNVRCCCKGEKILGTLEVQDGYVNDGVFIRLHLFEERPDTSTLAADPEAVQNNIKTAIVRKFYDGKHLSAEFAVHSDSRPIEFWRKVMGFKEGDRV